MEVAVHALADDGRVEVVADRGVGAALVEEEESVEHYVERIDGEFVLPSHAVDKLQFDGLRPVVAEGDEGPAVAVVDFDHF